MVTKLLLVALGGAVGSVLRFGIQRGLNLSFPYGTLLVNLAGSFLIGVLLATASRPFTSDYGRLLLVSGFCGGFTTFSAFTHEGISLLTQNKPVLFALYLSASVVGGFLLTWTGFKLFST